MRPTPRTKRPLPAVAAEAERRVGRAEASLLELA